jgi:hypothetical protein
MSYWSISIVTCGMGFVILYFKMSKEFTTSTKLLSLSKTFNLSIIECTWIVVQNGEKF